ncbi:MAG: DUF1460 domain-containing protein [Candidatus Obscuribacterales bacterium]|nr:DUF1460 domain-containing protein [Candidatus Obscuribacterales bacterium]
MKVDPDLSGLHPTASQAGGNQAPLRLFNRRKFLGMAALLTAQGLGVESIFASAPKLNLSLSQIKQAADKGSWSSLPAGERLCHLANYLAALSIPYRGGSLDQDIAAEKCLVDLNSFDCVTFVETCLALSAMLAKTNINWSNFDDLRKEITALRYRNGIVDGYESRLHYSSEWLYQNCHNGRLSLIRELPGLKFLTFAKKIDFMTSHPSYYKQIAKVGSPQFEKIARIENDISKNVLASGFLKYLPSDKLALLEKMPISDGLRSGDLVFVTTSMPGLDILHLGIISRENDGLHFINASSSKGVNRVVKEKAPLAAALHWSKSISGAIFARPLI